MTEPDLYPDWERITWVWVRHLGYAIVEMDSIDSAYHIHEIANLRDSCIVHVFRVLGKERYSSSSELYRQVAEVRQMPPLHRLALELKRETAE